MDSAKGNTGERERERERERRKKERKAVFSLRCGDETAAYDGSAFPQKAGKHPRFAIPALSAAVVGKRGMPPEAGAP